MIGEPRWIPELEQEALILQRVFLAEKWIVARLHYGHVDPREAGVGNIVNCGAAMYMAPVGLVNAGDPAAAYAEAIDIAGAHQSATAARRRGSSPPRWPPPRRRAPTVADVMAAATRRRPRRHARPRSTRCRRGRRLPEPGGRDDRASSAASSAPRSPRTTRWATQYRAMAMDARRPSRTKSIEELPVALGFVLAHDGDCAGGVLGAVNYGRDADSIATMAGAICGGARRARARCPRSGCATVAEASRLDLDGR